MADLRETFDALVQTVRTSHPEADCSALERALHLLVEHHTPQGVEAALVTAQDLAGLRLDPAAVAACLVAAVPHGPPAEAIEQRFGSEVANLVQGVRRLESIRWDRIDEEAAETLRKMFLAMAAEVRLVVIVLAMRAQKMRALAHQPDERERKRVARETLEVFAPLANRLGIWQFKSVFEDLSLRELEPETFHELTRLLEERLQERGKLINEAIAILREKLPEQDITAVVNGRSKHLYSIYKKMRRKQVGFDQVHDVSAVRVITDRVGDCYAALGLVHSLWVPIPANFDDYIARPKENLYQSLHTTVIGPGGKPLEVQIRTQEMHHYAEYGIAAHWAYKEGRKSVRESDRKFMVLRQLMDWESEVSDPNQLAAYLKTDIFKDQVYVFTPAGDIIDLPRGSSPLDFAYRVHTMVGHRCRGARVNDQIVTLDYQLRTGDRVEILTQKQPAPSRDWMNPNFGYLKTTSARGKVRTWFRQQGRDTAVHQGREIVDKELARIGTGSSWIDEIAKALGYDELDDMYAAVGFGDRSPQSVATAALHLERQKAPPAPPPLPPIEAPSKIVRPTSGVSFGGVSDILGKRARCCNPLPGDQVIGFISRGRGIILHRRDCPQINETEPDRWVEVDWGQSPQQVYPVEVMIKAQDRPGLLHDLSELVAQSGVNVRAAQADVRERDGRARIRLSLEFASADQVVKVLDRIGRHPDVMQVRRIAR